jgi:VanZ family protein
MRPLSRWIPAIAWAGLLLWLGNLPPSRIPSGPGGFDKLLHAGAYGVLGFLAAFAARRGAATGACAALLIGGIDEWGQSRVPGRYGDGLDLLADVVGGAIGGMAARWAIAKASD